MPRLPLLSLACLALLPACKDGDKAEGGDKPAAPSQPSEADDNGESPAKLSDKCDATKLTALTGALAAAKLGTGPDLVAKQLGDACELPSVFASFFALSAKGELDLAAMSAAPKEAHEALAAICPGAAVIKKQLASEPGDKRQGILYDKCDFKRFGLIERDAWLRGDPSSPVPFFAYDWFTQQGIADADAKTLATAMILRDRKHWEIDDQQLVTVANPLAPVPQGPAVYVTTEHITVNARKVAMVKDGKLDPSVMQGHLIGPLFDALAEEADKAKQMAKAASTEWASTLVVVADKRINQDLLIDVMYSAGRAEFSRHAFVAQTAPYEQGVLIVEAPRVSAKPEAALPVEFVVHAAADGFHVQASNAKKEDKTHIPMGADGKPDFAALTTAAEAFKKTNATADGARMYADGPITFDVVAQTLATLEGADCHTAKEACLLPKIVVAASGARNFDPEMMAHNAGILGALAADSGHFLASPYGAAFAVGEDSEDVWGGLTGSEVGEAFGVGGLGLVGTGEGGGGTGEGTIGLGNTGLIGKGGGGGTGSGYGRGSGAGFGGRGKKVPRVRQAKATVSGSLDKDIVRRIVRAHINEVRHCYNQGLVKDPALDGRVTIAFTIAATGKVSASSVSKNDLDDENVGTCIAKAVKRWKFPKPTGGGTANVVYPFVLSPG